MDAKITEAGLIELPADALTELGLESGDILDVAVKGDSIILRRTQKDSKPNLVDENPDDDLSTAVDFGQ